MPNITFEKFHEIALKANRNGQQIIMPPDIPESELLNIYNQIIKKYHVSSDGPIAKSKISCIVASKLPSITLTPAHPIGLDGSSTLGVIWPKGNNQALVWDTSPTFCPNGYIRIEPTNSIWRERTEFLFKFKTVPAKTYSLEIKLFNENDHGIWFATVVDMSSKQAYYLEHIANSVKGPQTMIRGFRANEDFTYVLFSLGLTAPDTPATDNPVSYFLSVTLVSLN
jgi:hypothetical protein